MANSAASRIGAALVLALFALGFSALHLRISKKANPLLPPRPATAETAETGTGIRVLLQAGADSHIRPDDRKARLHYAELLVDHGFVRLAVAEYETLLSQTGLEPEFLRARALALAQQGRSAEAASELLRAAPDDPEVLAQAADLYRIAGEPSRCLEVLKDPRVAENPEAVRAMAAAWIALHEPARAVEVLEPLARRAPSDGRTALLMGRALSDLKDPVSLTRALETLARAGAELGENAPVLYTVARAAERRGDFQTASRAYREAAEKDPLFNRAYFHLSNLLGNQKVSDRRLRAAIAHLRGLYRRGQGEPEAAALAFVEESRLQPSFVTAYADASREWTALNRPKEAISVARRALKASPDSPETWTLLALTCNEWNRPAEALSAVKGLQRCLAQHATTETSSRHDNARVQLLAGRIYLKSRQLERAVTALEDAVRSDPEDGVIRYWLGKALLESPGDSERARRAEEELTRACVLGAGEDDIPADYRMALGLAKLRNGNPTMAVPPLEAALAQEPRRADGYALLAQALRASGSTAISSVALDLYQELDVAGKRERDLRREADRETTGTTYRVRLGDFYLEQGDLEAARRVYLSLSGTRPADSSLIKKLREVETLLGIPRE